MNAASNWMRFTVTCALRYVVQLELCVDSVPSLKEDQVKDWSELWEILRITKASTDTLFAKKQRGREGEREDLILSEVTISERISFFLCETGFI